MVDSLCYFKQRREIVFGDFNDRTYIVGGAVRDMIMGIEPADVDYAMEVSQEELEANFNFKRIEAASFPVYLMEDGSEVALTRTEQSNGNSDKDFEITYVGVPIVEDLARRDFSINSISINYKTKEIVDPFDGVSDIKNKLLRTVNDKFVQEDPNRVYRLARFAAILGFTVESKTKEVVQRDKEYLKYVCTERILKELEKVYKRSNTPSVFFTTLAELDVLETHFKPLYDSMFVPAGPSQFHGENTAFDHMIHSFDYAKKMNFSFDEALAALFHDTGKATTPKEILPHHYKHELRSFDIMKEFCETFCFTKKQKEMILMFAKHHMKFHTMVKTKKTVKLIRFFRSIKKYEFEMIDCANCDHPLSGEQFQILGFLSYTFRNTKIEIPVSCKTTEQIVCFVENEYVKVYNEIKRKTNEVYEFLSKGK